MLKEAKRWYDRGFAILWLHPKSKRPIDIGWTSSSKKKWEELKAQYRDGMNMGVRLGMPSKINNGYLAVIDIDVKSTDLRHRKEAHEFAEKLVRGSYSNIVHSGRGNGSSHVYGTTPSPAHTKRLGQSNETVKVLMPSVPRVSRKEENTLSKEEIKKGIRLRPAWEISIMGEGSQVVLPPSIHPDSGKAYRWKDDQIPQKFGPLSITLTEKNNASAPKTESNRNFFEDVDLVGSDLGDMIIGAIISGDGVEDRSATLFSAVMSMVAHGFSDAQIASVLTDRTYFLGDVAYDHAKTDSRARAAQWVQKYNIGKARSELDASKVFAGAVELIELSDSEAEIQEIELITPEDWRDAIERTTGPESKPKSSMKNVFIILKGELGEKIFAKNEFSHEQLYTRDCPWGAKEGKEVTDESVVCLKKWVADKYRFEPATDKINEAITVIARENSFHPVKDYLESLEWDGHPRVDTWLRHYCNARAPEPYLSDVSRKTLVAMVARVYEPGVKFDQVLILEGKQGYGKSTTIRNLSGDEWFSDAHINISDKDGVLSMRSAWLIELGELSGMRKADVDQLKEFISRTTDRIRVPYGKRTEAFPRQCVFIGTTNSDEYLKDVTGNRRFWPVKVGRCDFRAIKRDRDQLMAEAKMIYETFGELLYLEGEQAGEQAVSEQAARMMEDVLTSRVQGLLNQSTLKLNPDRFTLAEIFDEINNNEFMKTLVKEDYSGHKRLGDALKKLGYEKKNGREKGTAGVRKYWFKPE